MEDINAKIAQLSPTKKALLEKLLQQENQENQQNYEELRLISTTISHRGNADKIPLSFAQQRLWFLQQLEPDSFAYYTPMALKIKGKLNIDFLKQALITIVKRHESLRTKFIVIDQVPLQVIAQEWSFELPLINLSNLSNQEQSITLESIFQAESQRPFDLTKDLMLRANLIKLSESEHILYMVIHHIASDGWSRNLLKQELITIYDGFVNGKTNFLPKLSIQYADFSQWQRNWLQGEVLASQLSYWKKQLSGIPPFLELPTDKSRPHIQTYHGASIIREISPDLTNKLKILSQEKGVTLFMTLLAGFQVLLYRYSHQEDIIIGTAIANRNRQEIEQLIGFFANTLALRINLENNPNFTELLSIVKAICLDAYNHQDLPFEKLVEELNPERSLSYSPIFQVMFILQNTPQQKITFPHLQIEEMELKTQTSKFDLTLSLSETPTGLEGIWNFNTDLFEESTIERMSGHFQQLLIGIVSNPNVEIAKLPILTERERHQLLVEWNNTAVKYPDNKCIHQLFEEQVERTPENIAVVFESEELTYRELNEKANQLAHYLQKLGVKSEVLVGICVERSLEMIIGLLGILKAGGAYVPMDPDYPIDRVNFMLNDAQSSVLITQEKLLGKFNLPSVKIVFLDGDSQQIEQEKTHNVKSEVNSKNLAYVIYTSGSTGRPKGVMIEHFSIVNILWYRIYQQLKPQDLKVFPFITSLSFDVSIIQIFPSLLVGGKIIIVKNLSHFATLMYQEEITFFPGLPSIIDKYIDEYKLSEGIESIGLGGEKVSYKLIQKLANLSHIQRIYNSYGPTETTVSSSSKVVFYRTSRENAPKDDTID